jgi:hypothetical protein
VAKSEELIGTTGYLALYAKCPVNRCRFNRVPLHFIGDMGESYSKVEKTFSDLRLPKNWY